MYTTISLFVKLFIIPLFSLLWMWKRNYKSLFDWFVMALFVGSYVLCMYFIGEWHIYPSIFRYLNPIIFVLVGAYTLYFASTKPFWSKKDAPRWFLTTFMFFAGLLSFGIAAWAHAGKTYEVEAIELALPLQNGTFAVIEGGDSPWLNKNHHLPDVANKFSVDLVKLGSFGSRSNSLFPGEQSDFLIFEEPVYSPITGVITMAVDSLPDDGEAVTDSLSEDNYGNRISLQSDSVVVFLGNLKQGSVTVSIGDTISVGTLLGYAGQSGAANEPVLHIHAYIDRDNDPWGHGIGRPILFEGDFLVRNSKIAN